MERLLQQPMTFLSAIAVVMVATIVVSPKWLHWWTDWKKFQASQNDSVAANGGTATSQTRMTSKAVRPYKTFTFWLGIFDILVGWGSLTVLVWLSADMSTRPATPADVALCAFFCSVAVIAQLRRW